MRISDWSSDGGSADLSERNMKIALHSGTVTPVSSLPHDSVIDPALWLLTAVSMASSTGGSASAPCPAALPAATTISNSPKYLCALSRSRMTWQAATSAMYHTVCLTAAVNSGGLQDN